MEVPDSIEREVILPVPPTRVWTALTQAGPAQRLVRHAGQHRSASRRRGHLYVGRLHWTAR